MRPRRNFVRSIIKSYPGQKIFGIYAFLPVFFCMGAALEFSMINWTVGQTNFYKTFSKRQAKIEAEERMKLALAPTKVESQ